MSVIEVKGLTFTYPAGVTALRGINLEIKKGEVIAIIGQNGSGKTTLVKHFNGLLKPTKGDVLVNNSSTKGLTTANLSRTVGYVFQNPDDQIFNSTVFKEIAFGPKNLGFKKRKISQRVNESLDFVGLKGYKRKHPLDLGLNEKKLIAIASILAMKPEVIILDEPTTGQDHEGVKKVISLINKLRKDHTVIIISHNMELVASIADRVIVMWNAEIIFKGAPKQVFVENKLLSKTYLKPPLITRLAQSSKKLSKDLLTINELVEEVKSKSHASRSR